MGEKERIVYTIVTVCVIIAGIIILLAVATFAILISYLGGIGAIICAILVAGFGQQVSETISEDN